MTFCFSALLFIARIQQWLLYKVVESPVLHSQQGEHAQPQYQISQPLTLPRYAKTCSIELLHRNFANSYYHPEIVGYAPPVDCGPAGSWAGISLSLNIRSNGTQYDRLAGITLDNVEIWRTSTSEPTAAGIAWTAVKDVTKYLPLFAKRGKLIMDLNNIVDPAIGLTGEYDVHLSAIFYQSSILYPQAQAADLILPLSTLKENNSNAFSVPPQGDTRVLFPRNAVSAFVEIQASGAWQEEFWYYNLPEEYLEHLPPDTTNGHGAFREVQVRIDGHLAGIAFPFVPLFTGAWVPSIWRPVVGMWAYDLPTYNIDITPFIPILVDGKPHTISLDVESDEPDHMAGQYWLLSGNIQVHLFDSAAPSTGRIIRYDVPPHAQTNRSVLSLPRAGDFNFTTTATHSLEIESEIIDGDGSRNHVQWKQDLSFSNVQSYLDETSRQIAIQRVRGHSVSLHNHVPVLVDNIDFPLNVDWYSVADSTGSGWTANFDHAYNRRQKPNRYQMLSSTNAWQRANGTYIRNPVKGQARKANGTTENSFRYVDSRLNTYLSTVGTENNEFKHREEHGSLSWEIGPWSERPPFHRGEVALPDVEVLRLPGPTEGSYPPKRGRIGLYSVASSN